MKEKTAIEVIYEIYDVVKMMESRIELMEKNINLLNHKANGELLESISTNLPKGKLVEVSAGKEQAHNTSQSKPRNNVRVHGKQLTSALKPIPGVEVSILDANNKIVKRTRTNNAGFWLSFLPAGEYSVEFIKEGVQPSFRAFKVIEGQSEVLVA